MKELDAVNDFKLRKKFSGTRVTISFIDLRLIDLSNVCSCDQMRAEADNVKRHHGQLRSIKITKTPQIKVLKVIK